MVESVAYPAFDGLLELACRDGVDIRPTLLRVLTDLYVQKPTHTADEQAQYVELAARLIEAVDEPTRAAVKARLSDYPAAPEAILRSLGAAGTRPAEAPVRKAEPPQPDLADLFFTASAEERRLILINLDAVAESPTRRLATAAPDLIRRLENAALQRNPGEFSRTLERALGISHALAERIVRDYSGEPIVVTAKALAMTADVLQRILLVLNPAIGQSVARVYDLSRLYDEIAPAAAERMLAIWRQTGARKAAHAPLHYDDERRSARTASTPAERRSIRSRDQLASSVKTDRR